jgi:hypothetical protein
MCLSKIAAQFQEGDLSIQGDSIEIKPFSVMPSAAQQDQGGHKFHPSWKQLAVS